MLRSRLMRTIAQHIVFVIDRRPYTGYQENNHEHHQPDSRAAVVHLLNFLLAPDLSCQLDNLADLNGDYCY